MTIEILGVVYYNVKDTAEMLNTTAYTVRDWCKEGKIKSRKIGREIYISEDEIREFLEPERKGE